MSLDRDLSTLIIVGDRVLVKPLKDTNKTDSGIFLPPGVQAKEKIQTGYIVKIGPGYPIPTEDEGWKPEEDRIKYIPLQAREGDKAIFLQKGAIEVHYNKEKYFIVSQEVILMLERESYL